jgi:hypothetical protein
MKSMHALGYTIRSDNREDTQIAFFDENKTDAALNALGHFVATKRGATAEVFLSPEAAQNWIKEDD